MQLIDDLSRLTYNWLNIILYTVDRRDNELLDETSLDSEWWAIRPGQKFKSVCKIREILNDMQSIASWPENNIQGSHLCFLLNIEEIISFYMALVLIASD